MDTNRNPVLSLLLCVALLHPVMLIAGEPTTVLSGFRHLFAPDPVGPAGVTVLDNHSFYVTSGGYLHIVGEVSNNTDDYLRYVEINVNLFSGDQLVDTDFTFTTIDSVPPRSKTCFDLGLSEPIEWTRYQFESVQYRIDGTALPTLTPSNVSSSYVSDNGYYKILGIVTNNESQRVEYAQPTFTLYDANNMVRDCDYTFVNSTHLDAGQSSSFESTSIYRDYQDITGFRMQIDGNIVD